MASLVRCAVPCCAVPCLQMVQWPVHCQCLVDGSPLLRPLQSWRNRADGVSITDDAQNSSIKSLTAGGAAHWKQPLAQLCVLPGDKSVLTAGCNSGAMKAVHIALITT